MKFSLEKSIPILERTPQILEMLLIELDKDWVEANEGEKTWSPYDIIGHFIHGEKTDWIPRLKVVLASAGNKEFEPFDRFAQFRESKGKTLPELIEEFKSLRKVNLEFLKSLPLSDIELDRTGIHPEFGEVNLRQLLATWVVHDLAHISQICRVMAKQYKEEIGPWEKYFRILSL